MSTFGLFSCSSNDCSEIVDPHHPSLQARARLQFRLGLQLQAVISLRRFLEDLVCESS